MIELLVVIAIIAALAGLLFAVMPGVNAARASSMAKAEREQIKTALEGFKARYGFYPPSGTNYDRTPLYLELVGTIRTAGNYQILEGNYSVPISTVTTVLKVGSLVNSADSMVATDDRLPPTTFLKDLKTSQFVTNSTVRLLGSAADEGNIWRYNSANPTNNPGSYDLWIDIVLKGKTTRFSNWVE